MVAPLQQQFSPISVQTGQEFFRLNQMLQSSGDVFELDSSIKALALGPESDVADIVVDFFDQQQPTNIGQVIISPQSPFIGRLDALLATQIPSSTTQARIQATTRDLVDNGYFPRSFDNEGLNQDLFIARVRPSIDLLAYLSDPAFLPPGRADRVHLFPYLQTSTVTGVGWVIVPFYGRRYASIALVNLHATVTYSMTVFGATLSVGTTSPGGLSKQGEFPIGGATVAAPGVTANKVITAADGLYDLLEVRVAADVAIGTSNDFNSTLKITVSDQEA